MSTAPLRVVLVVLVSRGARFAIPLHRDSVVVSRFCVIASPRPCIRSARAHRTDETVSNRRAGQSRETTAGTVCALAQGRLGARNRYAFHRIRAKREYRQVARACVRRILTGVGCSRTGSHEPDEEQMGTSAGHDQILPGGGR